MNAYRVYTRNDDTESFDFGTWTYSIIQLCTKEWNCGCYAKGNIENCGEGMDSTRLKKDAILIKKNYENQGIKAKIEEMEL